MVKLLAFYKKPQDPAEFDRKYHEEHMPLALKMPGLRKCEVAKVKESPMGEPNFYMVAELTFDNMDSLKAAMASPEGKAAGKNIMSFAADIVHLVYAEMEEKVPVGAK
jgi:uncharacterized protein (TIGR02118 family)